MKCAEVVIERGSDLFHRSLKKQLDQIVKTKSVKRSAHGLQDGLYDIRVTHYIPVSGSAQLKRTCAFLDYAAPRNCFRASYNGWNSSGPYSFV
jgi:hypothetical protein